MEHSSSCWYFITSLPQDAQYSIMKASLIFRAWTNKQNKLLLSYVIRINSFYIFTFPCFLLLPFLLGFVGSIQKFTFINSRSIYSPKSRRKHRSYKFNFLAGHGITVDTVLEFRTTVNTYALRNAARNSVKY
jgi:hypothetical protein